MSKSVLEVKKLLNMSFILTALTPSTNSNVVNLWCE